MQQKNEVSKVHLRTGRQLRQIQEWQVRLVEKKTKTVRKLNLKTIKQSPFKSMMLEPVHGLPQTLNEKLAEYGRETWS